MASSAMMPGAAVAHRLHAPHPDRPAAAARAGGAAAVPVPRSHHHHRNPRFRVSVQLPMRATGTHPIHPAHPARGALLAVSAAVAADSSAAPSSLESHQSEFTKWCGGQGIKPNKVEVAYFGAADEGARQGLTLVHFAAQLERFVRDRGCT